MELILNFIWLMVAAAGFVVARNRPRQVWLAIACAAAVLFPIISVSDDFNANRTLNDAAAGLRRPSRHSVRPALPTRPLTFRPRTTVADVKRRRSRALATP